jgi:hypothetical protein
MKKLRFAALCFALWIVWVSPSITHADILLEYGVMNAGAAKPVHPFIAIKNDSILFKEADGSLGLDLLYRRSPEGLVIVDHRRGTLMMVDEQEVDRINQQAKYLLPLVKTFGEQLERLSPDQRQTWQKLLGDAIPLSMITRAAGPVVPTSLKTSGERKVEGIPCRVMQVMHGSKPMAEICMTDAAAIEISEKDAATIRAFFVFYDKLAGKSTALAGFFGFTLPNLGPCDPTVIPVEVKDLTTWNLGIMKLHRVDKSEVSPELMALPAAYKLVPLSFWR